jgi:hypothetical protein
MRIQATKPLFAWDALEDSPTLKTIRQPPVLRAFRRGHGRARGLRHLAGHGSPMGRNVGPDPTEPDCQSALRQGEPAGSVDFRRLREFPQNADTQLTPIRYKRTLYAVSRTSMLALLSEPNRVSSSTPIQARDRPPVVARSPDHATFGSTRCLAKPSVDPTAGSGDPRRTGGARDQLLQALREQITRLEGARRPVGNPAFVPSGCEPLDRLLPDGGFRGGTLVEWLAAGDGTSRETLAFGTAREACREGGAVVVLDDAGEFYAPAAVRLGIPPEQMIVVRASTHADNIWALDQALRCPAVAAVVAWLAKLDAHTFRRLQLAAEEGGGLGLLVRPEAARHEPSWAEVRLWIEPLPTAAPETPRRLKIQVLRSPHRTSGGSVEVEIDHETHLVHPAGRLAHPADPRRAAGA